MSTRDGFNPTLILIGGGLIMAICGLVSCNLRKEINVIKKFNSAEVNEIQVKLSSEPLTIIGTKSGSEITFRYYGKAMQENTLAVDISNSTLTVEPKRPLIVPLPESLRLDIEIPQDYAKNLTIKLSSGSVHIDSLELANFKLETSSGRIDIQRLISTESKISATSGDITIATGQVQTAAVETTSGQIAVQSIAAKELKMKASSGNITVGSCQVQNASIETSSGSIQVTTPEFAGKISLAATSGSIRLILSKSAEFIVKAITSGGSFQSDFVITPLVTAGLHEIARQVGTKNNHVELATSSGKIEILQARK